MCCFVVVGVGSLVAVGDFVFDFVVVVVFMVVLKAVLPHLKHGVACLKGISNKTHTCRGKYLDVSLSFDSSPVVQQNNLTKIFLHCLLAQVLQS